MTSDGQREKAAKTSVLCEQQLHPLPVSQQHETITLPDLAAAGHHAWLIEVGPKEAHDRRGVTGRDELWGGSHKAVEDCFPFGHEVNVHVLYVLRVFLEFQIELDDGLLVGQNHVDSRRSRLE
ncbi:hypothetical protein OUZ56_033809 [Daphnia magna]|uniref:Uncharacterized protein n=1 Tax=Daphnia magna TaxID=35525 RepID=A0ABQ9ZZ35_9CRUS|nr:hypothetical protein OUZ56_033809 [Daphnia magna]